MCIAPCTLPDGQQVACRNCWQCRSNKINDFVGRCIAESKSAVATHAVTLTYGRDGEGKPNHARANVLTYSDVQKWLKRLRVEGFPLRYLVAGEYGAEKGRAHWHIIIFWQEAVPEITLEERVVQAWWDHGWSFFEVPRDHKAFRYVCKYVMKDTRAEKQSHFMMSKIPPLGTRHFEKLAERYVEQRLAPQDLGYRFPEGKKRNGEPITYYMQGRAAELFLEHYVHVWGVRYPGEHMPQSELVETYLDGLVPDELTIERRDYPEYGHKPKAQNLLSYMRWQDVTWSESVNAFKYTDPQTGNVLWWAKNPEGYYQWQGVIGRGRAIRDQSSLPPASDKPQGRFTVRKRPTKP